MDVSQVDELLADQHRMDSIVAAMANFLAEIMVMKDEEQARSVIWDHEKTLEMNKKQLAAMREAYWKRVGVNEFQCSPFGNLLYTEFAYKADEAKEAYLRNLHGIHAHTLGTMKMCASMIEESKLDHDDQDSSDSSDDDDDKLNLSSSEFRNNVDLLLYAFSKAFSTPHSPYFFKACYQKPNGGHMFVGAVARGLQIEFERLLWDWLHKCDRVFCEIHGLDCEENVELDEFISMIATGLSRRQAALFDPNDKELKKADIGSQPSYLLCKAEAEFVKNSAAATLEKKHDTKLLKDLLVLAKEGGRSKAGQEILLLRTSNVLRVMDRPPQELGVHVDKRWKRFSFDALRPAFTNVGINNPFLCRCECATSWSDSHGEWVAEQIEQALKLIWRNDYLAGVIYHNVASTKRSPQCVTLPPNPCAYEEENWFAHQPEWQKRCMLTNDGMRLVCIAALVWNKLEHGCFKFGTSRKSILANIASDHMRQAKYMEAMLDADRLINSQGVKLRMFERNFHDMSSDVADKLGVPMCKLSGVSMAEMYTLFNTKKGFEMVRHKLSSTARKLVSHSVVPEQYVKFTDDALSIVFDTIHMRRQAHGLSIFLRPNPISDMLRCIPKVRSWDPLHGFLRLDVSDLKHSPPQLRSFLDHHAATPGSFVKKGSKGSHAKLQFAFDSVTLGHLLKN